MRTKGHGTERVYLPSVAHSDLYTFIKTGPKCLAWGPISHPRVWIMAKEIMPDQKKKKERGRERERENTFLLLFITIKYKGQAGERRQAGRQ